MHSAAPTTADSPPFGRGRCPSQPLLYDNNARMANRPAANAHALDIFRPRHEAQVLLLPSRRGPPPRTSSQPPNAMSQPQFAPPGAGPMAPAMLVAAAQPMAAAARARPPMHGRRAAGGPAAAAAAAAALLAVTTPPQRYDISAAHHGGAAGQPLRRRPLDVLGQVAGPLEAVESFGHELHRQEITSVRQLQRALQAKIGQQTRGAVPIFRVFQRLDRRRVGLVDAGDLHAALETLNLEAPDELVSQLVTSLDLDHDGALCLSEFVAGFKEGNRQGLQLRSPQTGVSSRRHFRRVPFHHPIHNAAEAIMPSNTLAFLGGS